MTKHLTRLVSLFLTLFILVSCDMRGTGKYFLQQTYPHVHVETCMTRNNYILVDTITGLTVHCEAISDDGQYILRPQKIFVYPEQCAYGGWVSAGHFFATQAESGK